MHVSDLYGDELLKNTFGSARVVDLGKRFREVSPDFPQGKGDKGNILPGHALQFLLALAKSKSINDRKEVYRSISSIVSMYNETGESLYVALNDLLSNIELLETVYEVRVSMNEDFAQIVYNNGRTESFKKKVDLFSIEVDQSTIFKAKFLVAFASKYYLDKNNEIIFE